MSISRYLIRTLMVLAFVYGLSVGEIVFAGEPGAKEELDFELSDETVSSTDKIAASEKASKETPPPKTDKEPPVMAPVIETVVQKTDTPSIDAPSKKPVISVPVKAARGDRKLIKPRSIKTHPIKVKEKKPPASSVVKAVKAPGKREEIAAFKTEAVSEARGKPKGSGFVNRWFGIETGVGKMDASHSGTGQIAGGIYTLLDCINIAIKNSIQLQVVDKSVKLAQTRIMEARRNMLPTATVVFEPYSGTVSERNYIGRKQYIEGSQPVFRGGELYYTLKQAETNLEITKNERNKTKNELVLQVKKAYYTLAKSENNQLMQRELADEVERITRMVNDQYNANVASKLELLNVSSQASQIKYQLASAEGDVAVAELILKQAMNVEPEVKVTIRPSLEFKRVEVNYENALSAALVNRPEMVINTLMMEYYLYGKRIAIAKGLPKVDIMGNWGLAKENYTPMDNAWDNNAWADAQAALGNNVNITPNDKMGQQWYAGVKGSLPVWGSTAEYSFTREQWTPVVSAFQGTEAKTHSFKFKILDNLAMYSEKQLAEVDFERARQEFTKIKQDVTLEVKEQCFNYQKALIQLDTATNKVKYQSSDLEFIKMKRGLDEVPDSNVIESMIKFSQERFGYVQALTDCHIAIASINKAIGSEDYYKDE